MIAGRRQPRIRERTEARFGYWLKYFVCAVTTFVILLVPSDASAAAKPPDYALIKKYLQARMYPEAYLEVMRAELKSKEIDPKLQKLKRDLLNPVKKEATQRARVNEGDVGLRILLADIAFQEGRLDDAVQQIDTVKNSGNPGMLGHYTLAKVLFRKNNLAQACAELEIALKADPGSDVLFDDFTYLYNCKNYGQKTAQSLTPNSNFPKRATPIAANSSGLPDNPFANDPTRPPDNVPPPEDPQPPVDPMQNAQAPGSDGSGLGSELGSGSGSDDNPLPPDDPDNPIEVEPPTGSDTGSENGSAMGSDVGSDTGSEAGSGSAVAVGSGSPGPEPDFGSGSGSESEDPEHKSAKEIEKLLAQAKSYSEAKQYEEAEMALAKVKKLAPDTPGLGELADKITTNRDLEKQYKVAIDLFERGKFDLARDIFEKAYAADPVKYADASLYLGKIFLLTVDPGTNKPYYTKAHKYFEIYLKRSDLTDELRRDVEWLIIGILADSQKYEDAYERFTRFDEANHEFAVNQKSYTNLKYKLWFQHYYTEVVIGSVVFIGLFVFVFMLTIIPNLRIFGGDPVERARAAFEKKDFEKVAKVTEQALKRGNLPIQIKRQVLEYSIKANFVLKNYFKCQDLSKELLVDFPENAVAADHLARAYLESKDTSPEAITVYESTYLADADRTEFLPLLAAYYAQQKEVSEQAITILQAHFETNPGQREATMALAEAYTQNKKMGDEVAIVLERALTMDGTRMGWRELLARNYARKNMFAEAVEQCKLVLTAGIENMGIHVVYTTCMKKLNMLDEAILQYEQFLQKHPDNPQLQEILTELRREMESSGGLAGSAPLQQPFAPELGSVLGGVVGGGEPTDGFPLPGGLPDGELPLPPALQDTDIESFVEPPPDGFAPDSTDAPLPEFLKEVEPVVERPKSDRQREGDRGPSKSGGDTARPTIDLPKPGRIIEPPPKRTLADDDDDRDPRTLPKKKEAPPIPPMDDAPHTDVDDILNMATMEPFAGSDAVDNPAGATGGKSKAGSGGEGGDKSRSAGGPSRVNEADVASARTALLSGRYQDAIDKLGPIFATNRSHLQVGVILADAYLNQGKADLAKEIVETMSFDRELMPIEIKDLIYRIGVALEELGDPRSALQLYDIICQVDINYKDVFDRSDRLYQHR